MSTFWQVWCPRFVSVLRWFMTLVIPGFRMLDDLGPRLRRIPISDLWADDLLSSFLIIWYGTVPFSSCEPELAHKKRKERTAPDSCLECEISKPRHKVIAISKCLLLGAISHKWSLVWVADPVILQHLAQRTRFKKAAIDVDKNALRSVSFDLHWVVLVVWARVWSMNILCEFTAVQLFCLKVWNDRFWEAERTNYQWCRFCIGVQVGSGKAFGAYSSSGQMIRVYSCGPTFFGMTFKDCKLAATRPLAFKAACALYCPTEQIVRHPTQCSWMAKEEACTGRSWEFCCSIRFHWYCCHVWFVGAPGTAKCCSKNATSETTRNTGEIWCKSC